MYMDKMDFFLCYQLVEMLISFCCVAHLYSLSRISGILKFYSTYVVKVAIVVCHSDEGGISYDAAVVRKSINNGREA
jgi:hypothetical protein